MDADRDIPAGSRVRRTDVLVVGAGPAGLVAGIVLARLGVAVLVVDKRPEGSTLSRALAISTRSMELLRSWGLEDQVRAGAADVEPLAWVTPTLASGEGTEMPLGFPTAAEAARVSPTRPAWAPQDLLEPILLGLLRSCPNATVRFGVELLGLEQDAGGVRTVLRERESGRLEQAHASYVIGADGAHSTTRAQLDIAMSGPDDLGDFQRVEFCAPLAEVVAERRYGLYVITHPDVAGVLAPRGRGDRWGLSREWRPGSRSLLECDHAELATLIGTAVGVPGLRPAVERTSSFFFAAQIADRYRAGRAFLVGDAAHRMTPRGGTGMNTAIQDAYDIGWKLAWVLRGWARPGLLESYEVERRPVGLHNVQRGSEPGGAKRDAADALPWDLNGRLGHHWLDPDGQSVSTLDVLGPGLSLLTGPHDAGWAEAMDGLRLRAPVSIARLDAETTSALELDGDGAVLVRPDARPVGWWSSPTATTHADALTHLSQ